MNDPSQSEPEDEFIVPARLSEALAELDRAEVPVPPARDEAILRLAREHLAAFRCAAAEAKAAPIVPRSISWLHWLGLRLRTRRRMAAWSGALAALALGGLLASLMLSPGAREVAGDLNGDGRVDVLDALVLARRVERGESLQTAFDFNRDGVVDGGDARQLAAQAVALGPGGQL